jgi:hypothetical protein
MVGWIDGCLMKGWKVSISETIPAWAPLDLTKLVVILG